MHYGFIWLAIFISVMKILTEKANIFKLRTSKFH